MLTEEFYLSLAEQCESRGLNPADILLAFYIESGGDPGAFNSIRAAGLNQMVPSTLKENGKFNGTPQQYAKLQAHEQLPYIFNFFDSISGLKSGVNAPRLYQANFLPGTLSLPDDPNTVLASQSHHPEWVKANPLLDFNKDGKITVGDIRNIVKQKSQESGYQKLLSELNSASSQDFSPNFGSGEEKKTEKSEPMETDEEYEESEDNLKDSQLFDKFKPLSRLSDLSKLTVIIKSADFNSGMEYSRILKLALSSELNSKSEIYTDGKNIQLLANLEANPFVFRLAVQELCDKVSIAFESATTKLGKIKTSTLVKSYNKPLYKSASIQEVLRNYQSFHLRFLGK